MNSGTSVTIGEAALNVVIGMSTVFVILILISLIIYAFCIIPKIQDMFAKGGVKLPEEDEDEFTVALSASGGVTAAGAASDTGGAAFGQQDELIAVIAAAISAGTGLSTDSFVVRSIRRR